MSDAMTDGARDEKISNIVNELISLEKDFKESPDKTKAEKLIIKWEEYGKLPSGFWCCPDPKIAAKKIDDLRLYIDRKNEEIITS